MISFFPAYILCCLSIIKKPAFSDFIFEDALDDGRRMIEYASKLEGIEKVHLLGFSMGGAISSLIAMSVMYGLTYLIK